jgi:hypothetical protein
LYRRVLQVLRRSFGEAQGFIHDLHTYGGVQAMFLKVIVAGAPGSSRCHVIDTCFPQNVSFTQQQGDRDSNQQLRSLKVNLDGSEKTVGIRIIEADEKMMLVSFCFRFEAWS